MGEGNDPKHPTDSIYCPCSQHKCCRSFTCLAKTTPLVEFPCPRVSELNGAEEIDGEDLMELDAGEAAQLL